MRILGLAASKNDPASRFRILQFKSHLNNLGTFLNYNFPYPPKESAPSKWVFKNQWLWLQCQIIGRLNLIVKQTFFDVIWQNRLLISDIYSIERFYKKKKFVFDLDDSIWLTEGKKCVDKAISKANIVFAGNEYLATYCSQFNKNTKIIPSVVDTSIFQPIEKKDNGLFTIGWIGTESNFPYLEIIKEPILQFLRQTNNARFIVVSSKQPTLLTFDNNKIVFQQWNIDYEVELINNFDVGIMPLYENEWTKGKCGYKILQYMSCGIPFIASPVGVNSSFLNLSGAGLSATTKQEWLNAFNELYYDYNCRKSLAEKGRPFVEMNFSCHRWAPIINEFFKSIV